MKKMVLRLCLLSLTAGWMLLIFGFSAQSGEESGGLSAIIAEPLTRLLVWMSDSLNSQQWDALYQWVDGAVRGAAHFGEYAILGGLLMLMFHSIGVQSVWLPWICGTFYALTDEWHQSFSPGRVCDLMDVLIDASGVLAGVLICNIIIQRWRKKNVHNS